MKAFFWISVGAIFGANLRYWVGRWAARVLGVGFPYGTLIINITGSLILGFFLVWTTERVVADAKWRLLIAVGFCGAYTTFSTYTFETMALLQQGQWKLSLWNVVSSNLIGLCAVLAGMTLARSI